MSGTHGRPVLAVLEGTRPAEGLEALEGRMIVRRAGPEDFPTALAGADAALLWDFFSPVAADQLSAPDVLETLRWVHVPSAGVDQVLTPGLVHGPVTVTNAVGIFDLPIAEYVLGCVLAHVKELFLTRKQQDEGLWATRETAQLAGTRALVIGAGGIGRAVARLLRAVGVEVEIAARTARVDGEFGWVHGIERLPGLVSGHEVIVAVLPSTPRTQGLISSEVIEAFDHGSFFVNVGRGATIDEGALLRALESGRLSGAALDVFRQEPLPADHPLRDMPHVFVSPHMSSRVAGWQERLMAQFLENCERWLAGAPLQGVIDKKSGHGATVRPRSRGRPRSGAPQLSTGAGADGTP